MAKESGKANGMGRRQFLQVTGAAGGVAATGFALAVQPVGAKTVHTSAEGILTGDIVCPRGGDKIPLYIARPEGEGPFPAVIVIHEIFGQHEHIRDIARRFAHEGFIAAAPELYFREGGVSKLESFGEILQVVRSVPDRQMLDDLGAVLDKVKTMGMSNGKVGVTGFCWGGGAAWLFVADNPGLSAGVAWYGRLTNWGSGKLHPKNPIDRAAEMNAPVLGLYGGKDRGITADQIQRMKDALNRYGKTHRFVVYPNAPHAFHADYRKSYRKRAAQDGWKRCLAWFRRYLS